MDRYSSLIYIASLVPKGSRDAIEFGIACVYYRHPPSDEALSPRCRQTSLELHSSTTMRNVAKLTNGLSDLQLRGPLATKFSYQSAPKSLGLVRIMSTR